MTGNVTKLKECSEITFPSPGSLHSPAADPIESDPLAQEPDEVIPDPNPAPKAGANKRPNSKSKILHRDLNGKRLFTFPRQSASSILQLYLVMNAESLSRR